MSYPAARCNSNSLTCGSFEPRIMSDLSDMN